MFNFLGNLHNPEIIVPTVSLWAAQNVSSLPTAREGNENKSRDLHFHMWQFDFQGNIRASLMFAFLVVPGKWAEPVLQRWKAP